MNIIVLDDLVSNVCESTPFHDIQRAVAHLAAIVESSDDAIISKTVDGRILTWNSAAQRVFGYSAAEAVGRSIYLIVPPDRLEEERRIMESVTACGRIEQLETKRVTKDGRTVDVAVTISPVRDTEGIVIGAADIARDITARKQADEKLRESERALRQANEELRSRTEELARFNQAAVGREMRIVELKRELNDILVKTGQQARYALEFDEKLPASVSHPARGITVPYHSIRFSGRRSWRRGRLGRRTTRPRLKP